MIKQEILDAIKERGLLLEKEIFDLLNGFNDANAAKSFLIALEQQSGQKIITRSVLNKNFEFVKNTVGKLQGEDKSGIENIFVKLGLSLEVTKEKILPKGELNNNNSYKIFYSDTKSDKKVEVNDFVGNFRVRYSALQKILMQRSELKNLISINRISGERQALSIIGIVSEKRFTKNKNLIIKFEDLTGEISALVKASNTELFEKASELQLDDIVGVKTSGNRDLLFVFDIFFPDAMILEKMKFDEEVCVGFLSDTHCGGKKHLKRSFGKFIEWINSGDETAKKIKYLFFSGDNIDGVGVYPGQENSIELKSTREQYELLASYLKKIPERITMFMCPGQHDSSRLAEPQPIISKRYGEALYGIENLILVTNPAMVKLIEKDKEFKILMYHGDSISDFIREIKELREAKAFKTPAKAVKHMLKRRHLAPTHSSAVYIPNAEKDPLVISEVPDVLCTGEMHRADIENYNGVLIVTGSCWQSQTPFEEKRGNVPDPCKVPILNLKTREIKIFDFTDEKEIEEKGGIKIV